MNKESQRIAIAEACPNTLRYHHGRWQYTDGVHWWNCKGNDPLTDLNAMHEAEKVKLRPAPTDNAMDRDEKFVRWDNFIELLASKMGCDDIAHATAAQRAEAFLRTLNLWTK